MTELFSDQDAVTVLEQFSPEVAASVKRLVKRGERPRDIVGHLQKRKILAPLIVSLIHQAAHHYAQEER